MQLDYYKILGVGPTADLETIARAFRRRAGQCHPDHGVHHAHLVAINPAWAILSDPELRSRYDLSRKGMGSASLAERASHDRDEAQQWAENYPRTWPEYESWLGSI